MLGSSVDLSCGRPFPISLFPIEVLGLIVIFSPTKMNTPHVVRDVDEVDGRGLQDRGIWCPYGTEFTAAKRAPYSLVAGHLRIGRVWAIEAAVAMSPTLETLTRTQTCSSGSEGVRVGCGRSGANSL